MEGKLPHFMSLAFRLCVHGREVERCVMLRTSVTIATAEWRTG